MEDEEWRDVVGYEGSYIVSNKGSIKSLDRYVKNGVHGKILIKSKTPKIYVQKQGYHMVRFSIGSHQKLVFVHRVVAQSFIPNPDDKKTVNHKNGIKSDNRVENLEWASQRENNLHAFKTGLQKPRKGISHHKAKLKDSDIIEIRLPSQEPSHVVAERYGVSSSTIRQIRRGDIWRHL